MTAKITIWALLLVGGGLAGSLGTLKLQKPPVIPEPKCVCNCPEPQQGNSLDLEKVKGKGHHFHIHQDTKIQITGGEALLMRKLDSLLNERKTYRCK